MHKLLFFAFFTLTVSVVFCQQPITASEQAALDSMKKNDEFLKMLEEVQDKSYWDIGIGFGNGSFSSNNMAENSLGITKQLVVTPYVVYNHKSGFSLGIKPFFTNDSVNGTKVYQTAITPSYSINNDKVSFDIFYTRYLCDVKRYNNNCLYQNEVYTSIRSVKGALQPSLSVGFANGKYREWTWKVFTTPTGVARLIRDSTHNTASYFSISPAVGHNFIFENVFSKKDEMDFLPSIMLNAGSDNLNTTHTNLLYDKLKFLSRRKRTTETNKFQLQSIGLSADLLYGVGKFYLQPSLYFDYYLPATTSKRLVSVFSFSAGFNF